MYESKFMEFIDKTLAVARDRNSLAHSLLKLISFKVLGKVENLEQRLEHAGSRPRCRDKFHEPVLPGSRSVQIDILPQIRVVDSSDGVTQGARFFEAHEKIGAAEYVNLFECHGRADAEGFHLLTVRVCKPDLHELAVRPFQLKRQNRPLQPALIPENTGDTGLRMQRHLNAQNAAGTIR
jgi:hypothetical protein